MVVAGVVWICLATPASAYQYDPIGDYRFKDSGIIKKDGIWHVFGIHDCIDGAIGCDATEYGFMHLTSPNLKDWTEVGHVVPPGGPGAWDADEVWAPHVILKDGVYYMFYTGVDVNGAGVNEVQKIGYATSTDLYNWTQYGSNPVFDCDTQSWAYWNPADTDGLGTDCRDPFVFWDDANDQWVMMMSARWVTNKFRMVIGIVTSTDLINWSEENYIPTTINNTTESAYVTLHEGTYYLTYTDENAGIKYITSSDIYTGWSAEQTLGGPELGTFAADGFSNNGRDFLMYANSADNTLDFFQIGWVNGSPDTTTMLEIPWAKVGQQVWRDLDSDGLFDSNEVGVDGVDVQRYLDDGDGVFEPTTDDLLMQTKTTGDDPDTVGTQAGFYQFTDLVPDPFWLRINPAEFLAGGTLFGWSSSTGTVVSYINPSDSQTVTTMNFGVKLPTDGIVPLPEAEPINNYLPTPSLIKPQDDQTLLTGRPLVTGLALSGNSVFLFLNGQLHNVVAASQDDSGVGNFWYRFRNDLRPGLHYLQLVARNDETREVSRFSRRHYFVTYPNVAPIVIRTDGEAQPVIVSGLAWSGFDVFLFVDGKVHAVRTATTSDTGVGHFAFRLHNISAGNHDIHLRQRSPEGTVSPASRLQSLNVVNLN